VSKSGNWEKRRIETTNRLGSIDRRTFIKLSSAGAAALIFGAGPFTERVVATPSFSGYPFTLGVASGDPLPDGVVLWTRLAPGPLAEDGPGGMPAGEKGRPSSAVPPLKNAKHPEDLLRMGRETSLPGRAATFSPPNALPVAPSTRSAGGARRVRVQPCGARGYASLPRSPRSPDGSARDERGVVRGQVGHLFGGA
jgi:hypothetical protein